MLVLGELGDLMDWLILLMMRVQNFPAENNSGGPEDEEMEKYPRVGEDEEIILQEVSDVHGQVRKGLWTRGPFIWNMKQFNAMF